MRQALFAALLLALSIPVNVFAQDEEVDVSPQAAAKLQLYPTRIDLADDKTTASVNVINAGIATGRYRAELADVKMEGDKALFRVDEPLPYSLEPFIRISPRTVTVPPGQSQKFRLLVRPPRDLPDGEYRTHLHVLMSSENVERESMDPGIEGFGVKMQPRIRVSMPVVYQKGELVYDVSLSQLALRESGEGFGRASVETMVSVSGNAGSVGDVRVFWEKGGQSIMLYEAKGVYVYRDVKNRYWRYPLEVPEGVQLSGGTLRLTYTKPESDGGGLLAETTLAR